ncbi:hypothetical protein [Hasllibacter sp. MH4015]|uniref:hypothetical protein n=1 Tax=Hasllibacter sp. MH4015 TaxID=2854029 RepID=UPI001CD67F79|nr:hypothetical protein [Hasllibacter sp. MH4015]
MPDHIRFILRHAAWGGLVAIAFVAGLLVLNVGNLWHLVTHTSEGMLAVIVLTILCWITFGSVQIGIRIMALAKDDDQGGGTRAPERVASTVPIRVRADRQEG